MNDDLENDNEQNYYQNQQKNHQKQLKKQNLRLNNAAHKSDDPVNYPNPLKEPSSQSSLDGSFHSNQTRTAPSANNNHANNHIHDLDQQTWLELLPQILFVAFIIFLVIYAAYDWDHILQLFNQFVIWVKEDPLTSSFAILVIYVGLVVFAFPILYMTIALGFAFSQAFESSYIAFTYGLIIITTSILMGGVVAFEISRRWLSKSIKRRCLSKHRSFIAINHVITKEGWRTVFLLRLTPFPYSVISYLLGFTALKVKDFIIGSLVVGLHVSIWLYIGLSLDHFKQLRNQQNSQSSTSTNNNNSPQKIQGNPQFEFFFLSGEIVIAFLVGFLISYKAKMELDRQIEEDRANELSQQSNNQNQNDNNEGIIELARFDQNNVDQEQMYQQQEEQQQHRAAPSLRHL
eukprot:403337312